MDIHMPHMDGLSATREIRRHARWQQLPIIALTAQARSEDVQVSREAGMNGHLTKPIDEVALYRALLEHCVGKPTKAEQVLDQAQDSGGGSAAFARLSRSPARRAHLLRGFLQDFGALPERIAQLLAQEQWPEMAALVHQIKGSASYLDAAALCAVADDVESAARRGQAQAVRQLVDRFVELVHACLGDVRGALQTLDGPAQGADATVGSAVVLEHSAVIALIERAKPLVASGNFAAQRLLEQLLAGAGGRAWAATAQAAQEAFDVLDTQRTLQLLAEIEQECQATRSG